MSPTKRQDFDPEALAQNAEQHGKDISSLVDRVSVLEDTLNKPEQLAATLEVATSDSKKLDRLFSKLFCDLMEKDEAVKEAITQRMKKTDRDSVTSTLKKWGGLVTGATLFVLGVFAKAIIELIISKI